jgi:hypothetical protein
LALPILDGDGWLSRSRTTSEIGPQFLARLAPAADTVPTGEKSMAARTADPSIHFSSLLPSLTNRDARVLSAPQVPRPEDSLGAFRGLAFALLFEFLFGFAVYGGWVLFRYLR